MSEPTEPTDSTGSAALGRLAWRDGRVLPAGDVVVSAFDRTLTYGLGAFETVRLYGGVPFRLERHLARLQASLASLGLALPPAVERLPAGVRELARASGVGSALVRITVTAGTAPDDAVLPSRSLVIARLRAVPVVRRPVLVGLAPFAHDTRSPLAGVKSTSYLVHYMLNERARAAGRLDDLMVDAEGHVREGTVSSVFVVRDGRLLTPPVSEGILPGVTRASVLELAEGLLPSEQRVLTVDDLRVADEVFLTGAGKGLVAIDELDGGQLPARRPVAERLAALLGEAIARECGAG